MLAKMKEIIPTPTVGGLPVGALSREQWADLMMRHCLETKNTPERLPVVGFSVNGQVLAYAACNPTYESLLRQADNLDADGQSLVMASRLFLKQPLPERVATTDFFHTAAAAAEKSGARFYLLGSSEENITTAVKAIRKLYPNLQIAGYRNGYFTCEQEPEITKTIVAAGTDILWVGFGVPLQEQFVLRNKAALKGIGWIKTCGGLFDYFSTRTKRAPKWMQKAGLEWLFRMIQEPRKYFWRYVTTNSLAAWVLLTRTHN